MIAVSIAGQYYFPCYDNVGNIVAYVDEAGTTVASYTYDAFGNTIASSGSMRYVFHHRFSTKYCDEATGLYYYGYRKYTGNPPRNGIESSCEDRHFTREFRHGHQ